MKRMVFFLFVLLVFNNAFAENIFADKGYKYNEKGNKHYQNGDYKGAISQYIRALSERDDPVIKYNLANSLYKLKNYDKAIEIYKKIENSVPDYLKERLYYNLGNAYFKKKQYKMAVDSYVRSLKVNPKDRYAKENLELALKMLNKNNKNDKRNNRDSQKKKKEKDKNRNKKNENKKKDKNKKKENKENRNKKQKQQNNEEKQKQKQLQKLLKTLAEQEKIDRRKNMKNKKKMRAVIDRMEKDW